MLEFLFKKRLYHKYFPKCREFENYRTSLLVTLLLLFRTVSSVTHFRTENVNTNSQCNFSHFFSILMKILMFLLYVKLLNMCLEQFQWTVRLEKNSGKKAVLIGYFRLLLVKLTLKRVKIGQLRPFLRCKQKKIN